MRKSFAEARRIFQSHLGMLRTAQAQKLGIDPQVLHQMVKAGLLIQETRGLFRLAYLSPLNEPDLVKIALRIPYSVLCLTSSLAFHNLTTQIPSRVYIAIPNNKRKPKLDYPPLEVIRLAAKFYSAGIETRLIDGVVINIYCKEKTIADCFKFRNKIGKDIAIEGLKNYFLETNSDIEKLLGYARLNRVDKIIRPYLSAIL